MCATGTPGPAGVGEENRVNASHLEVALLHGDRLEQSLDERVAPLPSGRVRQLDTDEQLGRRHSGNRHIVLVPDQIVEPQPRPLGGDEDRGVEDQSLQVRSCASTSDLSSRSSFAHASSGGWRLRRALT